MENGKLHIFPPPLKKKVSGRHLACVTVWYHQIERNLDCFKWGEWQKLSWVSWAREWTLSRQRIVSETQTGTLKLWLTFWQHASLCQITSFLLECDCCSPQSKLLLLLFFTQLPAAVGRVPVDCFWRDMPQIRVDGVLHVKMRFFGRFWDLLCKEIEAVLLTEYSCIPLCPFSIQTWLFSIWRLNSDHCLCLAFKVQGIKEERVFPTFFLPHSHSQALEPAWGATG